MMSEAVPWPPAMAGTPAVAVIEKAIARGRLSHGLLLAGDDSESLSAAAMALADRLLSRGSSGASPYPPERHPDCLQVRPSGKSRQITVDSVRSLIGRINVSPSVSHYKVAVLHDADRMNLSAANVFLKTLEEPPADTTLLLLTGRPHALLPTIRSRVLHFRFTGLASPVPVAGWDAWLADYRSWLVRLGAGFGAGRAVAEGIFALYGLIARFGAMLDKACASEGARRKASLPEGLEDDELAAIEAEIAVGLRQRMFADVERATRAHTVKLLESNAAARRPFAAAIDSLERAAALLRVNLNESAALEDFLLASLRIWTRR
ncbi:MAG TPA: DNA polymerase III subunit gamma/tau [Opitutaceae bacterium]|nr:DNA polymerase III subunit gamma/tau [Opitutaceae bacterium]